MICAMEKSGLMLGSLEQGYLTLSGVSREDFPERVTFVLACEG